jgi:hypothetical protein
LIYLHMSKPVSKRPVELWKILLLFILAGAAVLVLPVSAADKPVVTIVAQGSGAYYLGEEVFFSGMNTDTGSTYLYITGPNLPDNGGKLTSPSQKSVSGDPGSFTVVKTNADKTWVYAWYTSGLRLDAGSYTVYAASAPKTEDQVSGTPYGTTSIIVKKPYISANISTSTVVKGQPFTVTGIAEGIPPNVQIWIIGDNYAYTVKTPVNSDASFTFTADPATSGKLPAGQNYLIVQHPMADNQFDFVVSGDYVHNLKLNNGTNLFKLTGSGSLQGSDAADALITAINDQEAHDSTYTNDTYTLIPFQVTDVVSGASAGTGVTISADGDKSYYLGEKVVFRGQNTDSDTTYLFITGPGTFKNGPGIPADGGKLTSPLQEVVSGIPDSFTVVKTKPDKTWEYAFYTANLPVDAGTYNIYAVSQPKAMNQAGPAAAGDGIILKKPFITAQISPATIPQGVPFTVSGVAEGIPPNVQVWIMGENYYSKSIVSVNSDASYQYVVPGEVTSNLAGGQYFAIVQHPMQNNKFDIDVSGDYVKLNNGTNIFRISGPGNLRGSNAADALIAAISDQEAHDTSYTSDTYTLIPFQVTDAGSPAPQAAAATTASVQHQAQQSQLQYIPIGGLLLVLGIVLWKRH